MNEVIPFIRPSLPEAGRVAEAYARIVEANWFTNFGPAERELAERMGSFVGAGSATSTFANATLALVGALSGTKIRHREAKADVYGYVSELLAKATDQGDYFRVPLDDRGLQYEKYFSEGEEEVDTTVDYSSDSVAPLDVEQTVALLRTIPEIADDRELRA